MNRYILGIHYGHNATVAVAQQGKIIFCQSEERLNRIKNSLGFPRMTLEYIYNNICKPNEIESATIYQKSIHGYLTLKKYEFKSIQYGYFLSPETENTSIFRKSNFRWTISQAFSKVFQERNNKLKKESIQYFSRELKLPEHKIKFLNHHLSHAFSTISNIQDWENCLIFTLDGVGDYLSATVNVHSKNCLSILSTNDHRNSLGYFYSTITALLGMKAGEHEFKVMGLAPYSSLKYYNNILDSLKKLIWINNNGKFVCKYPPTALSDILGKIIQHQRFDNVAGAIQALTEELVLSWVKYWINKTGVKNVAVAGGVFMNVKACQKLIDDLPINKYFVMPSAADESTAIGAAFWGGLQSAPCIRPVPLNDLYLGMEFCDKNIEDVICKKLDHKRYKVEKPDDIEKIVAYLLSENKVVARFCGKMEFGARALGNRSILANPSQFDTIEIINSSIKNRDFWMPFTPSILQEDMQKYIIGWNKIFAPYMAITFKTTPLAQNHLKAAIHPRDKTARPQCVIETWNNKYHKIIREFKKITGIGAVLNTSFNLHGQPNVCSPNEAIQTLDESKLKYLAIGSFLITKF